MSVRLLYVEDDEDLRRLMSLMLADEGYDVVAVSSAEAAIVELQARQYQLLLTDYNLETKNADWMLALAEEKGLLRDSAVVLLTAEQRPAGVEAYRRLKKPVDVAVLFAALDEALGGLPAAPASRAGASADVPSAVTLVLYVTAGSTESMKAVRNLRRILRNFDAGKVRLEVIDVAAGGLSADAMEADRVVVTPSLLRRTPLPRVWVFGDLSKTAIVEEMIAAGVDALD